MTSYVEKLWPSPLVALAYSPLVPVLILVFAPFNLWIGVAVALVVYGVVLGAIYARVPQVTVGNGFFTYGNAQVELEYIGSVSAYSGESARAQRGPELDARAWVKFRAYLSSVVKVEITDADDPTPYWLVSTRRPQELAEALRHARTK